VRVDNKMLVSLRLSGSEFQVAGPSVGEHSTPVHGRVDTLLRCNQVGYVQE